MRAFSRRPKPWFGGELSARIPGGTIRYRSEPAPFEESVAEPARTSDDTHKDVSLWLHFSMVSLAYIRVTRSREHYVFIGGELVEETQTPPGSEMWEPKSDLSVLQPATYCALVRLSTVAARVVARWEITSPDDIFLTVYGFPVSPQKRGALSDRKLLKQVATAMRPPRLGYARINPPRGLSGPEDLEDIPDPFGQHAP